MRFIFLLVVAICLASSADAQLCGDRDGTLAARSNRIAEAENLLNRAIVAQIETVPPSDADYIDREQEAAIQQDNRARYELVYAHRFFPARQVQKHYAVISENLAAAKSARLVGDQAVYLSVVLSRYQDLGEALTSYYDVDSKRRNPVLTSNARREIAFDVSLAKQAILSALQCGVRQMREPLR